MRPIYQVQAQGNVIRFSPVKPFNTKKEFEVYNDDFVMFDKKENEIRRTGVTDLTSDKWLKLTV